jgi:hypothetical protein
MDFDFESLAILGLCTLGPAAIVLLIFTVLRRRRSRFHRQRITKGQPRRADREP